MRTFARLTMLCVSLPILVCAARAQPPQPPEPPRDEPCRAAAQKYAWPFSDKSRRLHMSVGESYHIALDAGVKYLRLCGKRQDAFTRHVRAAVAAAEAARRCEAETWPLYSKRVEVADSATRGRKRQAYEAAKKFLRLCQRYGTPSTSRAMRRVGEREACRASKALWERQIGIYYAYRHDGDDTGLEETIARAFDAPMPNP